MKNNLPRLNRSPKALFGGLFYLDLITIDNMKPNKMKKSIEQRAVILLIVILCLVQIGCNNQKNQNEEKNAVDYITETSGEVDFCKTEVNAYTPEIRLNMKKLYED